ncbi:hypothetical protein Ga0102493_111892 [Erythrobacter litoralis]|jgi:hypothetical protein|uniref:Uncharacterized protein n=1 Tax=Erythrobacter litoralis TaxID=39960 RepID=A0A074MH19_9SPHN|nr:hypothetical protein [Erythrobacter litoralis]AOL22913.1 hypothetical protein Ga0102493_111892 [Erythrobacter litoralis]KEO92789.1 hypothetical protein EH32_13420 [Erythrobacter litoralis]MEE4337800.1 hypothetical protein [Erythrobacter sp.]
MSWLSIFAVIFLILWLRERHLGKQIEQENEELRRRLGEGGAPSRSPVQHDDALDNRELEELRERIQVLERIATDNNSSEAVRARAIAAEIESLRGDIATRAAREDRPDRNTEDMDR